MRTRRKLWFFKQSWYSICSCHFEYDWDCRLCRKGQWKYDIAVAIDQFIHNRWYGLWYWWHNLPRNKRWLESIFPNLKKK